MGYKEISGIEFQCDNCGVKTMTAGDADIDGSPIPPKGWFGGVAHESTGERGTSYGVANWLACKASCIGNAVRKMVDDAKPVDNAKDPDA